MATKSSTAKHRIGSAFDLPAKSWEIVKNNWHMFAVVNILAIISSTVEIFKEPVKKDNNTITNLPGNFGNTINGPELAGILGLGFIVLLVLLAFSIFLLAMATSLEVRSTHGEKPTFDTLFDDGKKYWLRLLGLFIVAGLIIAVGLVLLIVPGIYAIGRLLFAPYFMVDKDLGIGDSLRASANLTKGNAGPVWAAIGVTILIGVGTSIISAIPNIGPIIGTLITIAFSLVIVLRYRELKTAFPSKAKPAAFEL